MSVSAVLFKLGDKEFTLLGNLRAFERLKTLNNGEAWDSVLARGFGNTTDIEHTAKVFAAFAQPPLTVDEAIDAMGDLEGLFTTAKALTEALNSALPEKLRKNADNPTADAEGDEGDAGDPL